ncbi:MAG: hypothetical protein ACK4F9_03970 [Brevinematia bacterium]
MKRSYKTIITEFIEKNFWGLLYSSIAIISFIIAFALGIGFFVLLLLIGAIAFVVGNSKDRNVPVLQNIKYFIDKVNNAIKRFKS